MNLGNSELQNLTNKVNNYKSMVDNTTQYRQIWKDSLKQEIRDLLQAVIDQTGLSAKVEVREELENLEAVVLDLGQVRSGLAQKVNEDIQRSMIRHNGALIYQQLFNGKIIVLINYPVIENYGNPRPPKTIAIYRPEELKELFFVQHVDEFITEITDWEDFDDDDPQHKIGFQLNFDQHATQDHDK